MSMLRIQCLFCGLFFLSTGLAQSTGFGYKSSLEKPSDQWHRIELPASIYQHLSPSFSSLRILGTTDSKDTIEVPYIVETKNRVRVNQAIDLEIINKVSRGDRHLFTFDLKEIKELNNLVLNFGAANFDWLLTLEGSQDLQEWFTISKDNRIVSIRNVDVAYTYSEINFPTSKFRYFRIAFNHPAAPNLINAQVNRNYFSQGELQNYSIKQTSNELDKMAKKNLVEVSLQQTVPVSLIKVQVENDYDYFRKISLQYLADSVVSPKGTQYIYRTCASGHLSSYENNEFYFPFKLAKKFRLVVDNEDNQPLNISKVTCLGHPTELIARFGETAADYALYFAHPKIRKPSYDITRFKEKIPSDLKSLSLAAPIKIKYAEKESGALFTNQIWLYAVMALIILLIGAFTLRMMKNA